VIPHLRHLKAKEEVQQEIDWWKLQMRNAKQEELAFVCWGIATGLMMAMNTYERERPRA
jgi:hypothetical protein